MVTNNIKNLLEEIELYSDTNLRENVEKRLEKTLRLYQSDLESICNKVVGIDKKIIIKELSK